MLGWLFGIALAADASVTAGEMTVAWTVEADRVVFELAAPTAGWLAVGLNDRDDLAGSRLVMAAVSRDVARAEEHVPRPPKHPKVVDLTVLASEQVDGWTRISVALPLVSERADAPALAKGARVWLTVAWSHAPEFDHHSAERSASWQTL